MKWWERLERWQVAIYVAAACVGVGWSLTAPASARAAEDAVEPVLALLLFATFVAVPIRSVIAGAKDRSFLGRLLLGNFVVVPLLVAALVAAFSLTGPMNTGLKFGILLVLLAPCVDYVIVFSGLAGGDRARLLASTPLLTLAQVLLLPILLTLVGGAELVRNLDWTLLVGAFFWVVAVPLVLAWTVQWLEPRHDVAGSAARGVQGVSETAMVPLMALTLMLVVASQAASLPDGSAELVRLLPLYVLYAAGAWVIGWTLGRRLSRSTRVALAFSTTTRNSLVVLPLALAAPPALALAPLAVVTQTFVELGVMVVLVALLRSRSVAVEPTVAPRGRTEPRD